MPRAVERMEIPSILKELRELVENRPNFRDAGQLQAICWIMRCHMQSCEPLHVLVNKFKEVKQDQSCQFIVDWKVAQKLLAWRPLNSWLVHGRAWRSLKAGWMRVNLPTVIPDK